MNVVLPKLYTILEKGAKAAETFTKIDVIDIV